MRILGRCEIAHHRRALSCKKGRNGVVTHIKRFAWALNLNIHFHTLLLDGEYVYRLNGSARFRLGRASTGAELTQLAWTIAHHVSRYLERQGLQERDAESSHLACSVPVLFLRALSAAYRRFACALITLKIITSPTSASIRCGIGTCFTVAAFEAPKGISTTTGSWSELRH